MSNERGARSVEHAAQRTDSGFCSSPLETRHRARPACAAFTLIELLVVVAIIAVLSALITPAVQGLMGTSGRRGALNTVTAVLEQARLSAVENGTTAYVGFPTNALNKTNGYSHLIIFRDAKLGDAATNFVAVTRWQRLPNGVFFKGGINFPEPLPRKTFPTNTLPRLGGSESLGEIPALAFNRFGQLQGVTTEISLLLGEQIEPNGPWRGSTSNYYELRIQPLTGRVVVEDASL